MADQNPATHFNLEEVRARYRAFEESYEGDVAQDADHTKAVACAEDVPTLLGIIASVPRRKHIEMAMAALSAVAYNPAVDIKARRKTRAALEAFEAWRLP